MPIKSAGTKAPKLAGDNCSNSLHPKSLRLFLANPLGMYAIRDVSHTRTAVHRPAESHCCSRRHRQPAPFRAHQTKFNGKTTSWAFAGTPTRGLAPWHQPTPPARNSSSLRSTRTNAPVWTPLPVGISTPTRVPDAFAANAAHRAPSRAVGRRSRRGPLASTRVKRLL
jgi:hypothetical protein